MLDKIDKAILRLLVKYKDQTLTVNQIAKKVVISPRTAKKHIVKLEEEGYVFMKIGKIREVERNVKTKKEDN